ncbi:hypothetical protein CcrBL47_gp381 [Caulobacter phage BL47]|nr:hypothetical protein CcrBL47_gp381 [Caulobacter phage BL47]
MNNDHYLDKPIMRSFSVRAGPLYVVVYEIEAHEGPEIQLHYYVDDVLMALLPERAIKLLRLNRDGISQYLKAEDDAFSVLYDEDEGTVMRLRRRPGGAGPVLRLEHYGMTIANLTAGPAEVDVILQAYGRYLANKEKP